MIYAQCIIRPRRMGVLQTALMLYALRVLHNLNGVIDSVKRATCVPPEMASAVKNATPLVINLDRDVDLS
jgi:F420-0:gamma-glutamyl ligase